VEPDSRGGEPGRRKIGLGITVIRSGDLSQDMEYREEAVAGVWLAGQGAGTGVSVKKYITADPEKCRIVFLIRDTSELEHAAGLIRKLAGENRESICSGKF